MWRLLDLRAGKYISIITLVHPNDWEMRECLNNYFEQAVINETYDFIRKNFVLNTPQSDKDKQEIIEQVISIDFLQELVGSQWVDEYQQDALRLYLDECLIETFPEYRTRKKALLELHRWFQGTKTSHFYDAIDTENNPSDEL
jgi:hypothetical protein